MSFAAIVAGAPFFLGEGDGVTLGVSSASGVADGPDEGSGDSSGVGDGDDLCFFFFGEALGEESGSGVGEDFFFFFGEALGEESGSGVGEDFFFFFGEADALGSAFSPGVGLGEIFFFFEGEGDGDFSGVADGFGVGDFSASSFFFGAGEDVLRCFFGAGVGVGAKIFLILLPNDSSVRARSALPAKTAISKRAPPILRTRRMERWASLALLLRHFRQDRFVQANAGIHVFERKILVRRMGPAIRERQTKQ
jgi:hypothetical protein